MPLFLEKKLKKEYGADSHIPYEVMNKIGAMHGNKETAKGREMERKHEMAKRMKKGQKGKSYEAGSMRSKHSGRTYSPEGKRID